MFLSAIGYLLKWCPLCDELLNTLYGLTLIADWKQNLFTVSRYHTLFTDLDMDKLNDQYLSYRFSVEEDIPNSVKESAGLDAEHPYRVDVLWLYHKNVKKARINGTPIQPTLPSC